jgi:hypothetical protein
VSFRDGIHRDCAIATSLRCGDALSAARIASLIKYFLPKGEVAWPVLLWRAVGGGQKGF